MSPPHVFEALPKRQSYTFTVTAADATGSSPPPNPACPHREAGAGQAHFQEVQGARGSFGQGRKIWALRQGNPLAPTVLLSIGQMHGSEPAGLKITKRVRKKKVAADADYQVWTIRTVNPDGSRRGNRYNARGVDLNRNYPGTWSSGARTVAGPPASPDPSRDALRQALAANGVLSFTSRGTRP